MARSASGVTVVTTGGFVLLPGVGSPVGELTMATLVIEPLAGALIVRFRFVVAFAARVPRVQLTMPPLLTPLPEAVTKATPAGRASVTTTPPALEGPKFVTLIV